MSGFTFRIVNNRGDLSELNLMLTADSSTGLEGIQLGKSTHLSESSQAIRLNRSLRRR
jgi:hypothetical protein